MDNHNRTIKWMIAIIACVALPIVGLVIVYQYNNQPPHVKIPTHSVPRDNGWDYLLRAGEILKASNGGKQVPNPDGKHVWSVQECDAFLRHNSGAIKVLRQGLARPIVHPALRSYDQVFHGSIFSAYPLLRDDARALRHEARYYALTGQPDRAMDSLLDCMELGARLPKGGNIMAGLIGDTVITIGTVGFDDCANKLDKGQLTKAALRLRNIHAQRTPFRDIILEEGCVTAYEYSYLLSHDLASMPPTQWFGPNRWTGRREPWKTAKFAFCNKSAVIRDNMDYYVSVAAEQSCYYASNSQVPMPRTPFNELYEIYPDRDYLIAARVSYERRSAFLSILEAEVALLRYQRDHGRYPGSLSQLVPGYLKSIPQDPFGHGRSLLYRATGAGGFLLYSLGPDLKDDAGRPGEWNGVETRGDIVAGRLLE